jgi:hypothetical protein
VTRLAELQQRFWRLMTAPEAVDVSLADLAARDPGLVPLAGWIRAADEATAIERLNVYANGYFFRLQGILRDDYPKLAQLVGAAHFQNLATGYLLAFPSRNPSVRHIGRDLAAYLDGHELTATWPILPDLARLEWARGEAFDAADAPAVGEAALAAVPPDRWPLVRLRLQPALRLLRLAHPVHRVWLALEKGDPPPEIAAAPTAVVVWRRGFRVYHRAVPPAEMAALESAAAGDTFAALCERVLPHGGADTPAIAVRALRGWLAEEMVSAVQLPP